MRLVPDPFLAKKEPNKLKEITIVPRRAEKNMEKIDSKLCSNKIEGALLGRFAGCTFGSPVEFWEIPRMEKLAKENAHSFPPKDSCKYVPDPFGVRYQMAERQTYTRKKMDGVPFDDNIVYTLLGLLTVEKYGANFTVAKNGKSWIKSLPHACTTEKIALKNLKKGIPTEKVADENNPFCERIDADIRSDPWGYIAPRWSEKAADMAYWDTFLTHRHPRDLW